MQIRWTKAALSNLSAIARYIEKDNPERAKTFIAEIRQKTDLLGEFPSAGRAGRVAGTRELVAHENYILAYRVKANEVQILRVHHVAQKFPTQLD